MTQVSKRLLTKAVEKRMFKVFWKVFADLRKPRDAENFLCRLLTPTEKTMLAKRLSIAILLTKGYSYREIGRILRVTPTTVNKISLWLRHSGSDLDPVIKRVLKDELLRRLFIEIEGELASLIVGYHPASRARVRAARAKRRREELAKEI